MNNIYAVGPPGGLKLAVALSLGEERYWVRVWVTINRPIGTVICPFCSLETTPSNSILTSLSYALLTLYDANGSDIMWYLLTPSRMIESYWVGPEPVTSTLMQPENGVGKQGHIICV